MARPKEFDRELVLEKAMHVFWAKGYECASMQELVDAMGINRGSIYATFGDKKKLHLDALDHFYKTEILHMMAPLDRPGSKISAIREIFEATADCACEDGDRKGCMMYNTAVELCPNDAEVNAKVSQGLKRVEECFFEALTEARAKGEIDDSKDVRALARFLTNSINGLRVMCMVFEDRSTLDDIIKISLASLD
jgi:TetR/AcrR family transcriptional repressor of nem operon